MPKKAPKKPKPKQTNIPGTARKVHKAVTAAAESYVETRDERMELTELEVEKNAKLVALMQKHELTEYIDEDAGLRVTIPAANVKAKVAKYKSKAEAEAE